MPLNSDGEQEGRVSDMTKKKISLKNQSDWLHVTEGLLNCWLSMWSVLDDDPFCYVKRSRVTKWTPHTHNKRDLRVEMKVMCNLKVHGDAAGKIVKGSLVTFPSLSPPLLSHSPLWLHTRVMGCTFLSAGSAWPVKSPALMKNKSYINEVENKGLVPVLYCFSSSQPPVEQSLIMANGFIKIISFSMIKS